MYVGVDLLWLCVLLFTCSHPSKGLLVIVVAAFSTLGISCTLSDLSSYITLYVVLGDVFIVLLVVCANSYSNEGSRLQLLFVSLGVFVLCLTTILCFYCVLGSTAEAITGWLWLLWVLLVLSYSLYVISAHIPKSVGKKL